MYLWAHPTLHPQRVNVCEAFEKYVVQFTDLIETWIRKLFVVNEHTIPIE